MMFSYDKKWEHLPKLYLEAKLLPWQLHIECHFTPCLMYITSAKFEEHRSNISKDILHFVICLPLESLMTSPVFKQKFEYLPNEKQYFKSESTVLLLF